jgi:hypothetical protein
MLLVLSGDPVEIARQLRDRAERTMRLQGTAHACRLADDGPDASRCPHAALWTALQAVPVLLVASARE